MKFSEFYKLLEEHGWRKDGGSRQTFIQQIM